MTTTTELQLTFKSSAGKKKSLNLPYAVKGLSADVVREAAAAIAGEGVFVKEGEVLYAEPLAANYIERTVTGVFDDSNHETDLAALAGCEIYTQEAAWPPLFLCFMQLCPRLLVFSFLAWKGGKSSFFL